MSLRTRSTRSSGPRWRGPDILTPVPFIGREGIDHTLMLAEKARRGALYQAGRVDERRRAMMMERCRHDLLFFADHFAWTFDPRLLAHMPMVLFPAQRAYLEFVEQRLAAGQDFLCEKSRDMGVTYLNVIFAVQRWLFEPAFVTGFCANLQDLVDQLGNPKSILEKARMILRRLPAWMMPEGFRFGTHDMLCKITNPATGALMIGEGGDNAGRGGRCTLYLIDEAAHLARPDKVNAATSATAKVRGWVSSVQGMGNLFARLRHEGNTPVIRLHWTDDPRKSPEWAEAERRRLGSVTFAQEHDIDYGASVEGLLIEKAWIDAAVELGQLVTWAPHGPAIAGLDVGVGGDRSVLVVRQGPLVQMPIAWGDPDTGGTALRAIEHCRTAGVRRLIYDSVGVGEGVGSTLRGERERGLELVEFVAGEAASNVVQADGRSAKEWFRNIRAEAWWMVRERCRRSYERVLFERGLPNGEEHPLEECLMLPNSLELRHELNLPRYFRRSTGGTSKIIIESKDELRGRGIKSPDHADALVMACYEMATESWLVSETGTAYGSTLAALEEASPWGREEAPRPW